jgi:hypothetical protein
LNSSIFGHLFVLLTRRDDDNLLGESVVWKALVVECWFSDGWFDSAAVGSEVPEVDPDVKAVIVHAVVSQLDRSQNFLVLSLL